MPAFRDLTGERFGRLVVLSLAARSGRETTWNCHCDCGAPYIALGRQLYKRARFSCGCLRLANPGSKGAKNPTWQCWWDMRRRCSDPRIEAFKNYGARGIRVCERWEVYENFLTDMGACPLAMTIDRINVAGNYEPGNCRWATSREQSLNKRTSRMIEINGVTKNLSVWIEELGIPEHRFHQRIRRGLSERDALLMPRQPSGWPARRHRLAQMSRNP